MFFEIPSLIDKSAETWYNIYATQTAYFSLIRENTLVKSVFSLFSFRIGESLCSNIRGGAFFRCIPSGVHFFMCG